MSETSPAVTVAPDDPGTADIRELLHAHLLLMRSLSPPGSVHALDLDGLRGPDIAFYAARTEDGTLLGVGAWKRLDASHGEIKSMHVRQDLRRNGVARIILERLIADARAAGLARLSLETGATDDFLPARTLYASRGFEPCGPFGDYTADSFSAFLTRTI